MSWGYNGYAGLGYDTPTDDNPTPRKISIGQGKLMTQHTMLIRYQMFYINCCTFTFSHSAQMLLENILNKCFKNNFEEAFAH